MAALVDGYVKLAEGIYLEGLSYDFGRDVVWYSDVVKGGIYGVRSDGTPYASFNEDRMWTGGVMMNACGAVLSSGVDGIMWNDPDKGRAGWLVQEIDGKPVNGINEMWPDGTGGIFFGTVDLEMVIQAKAPRPTAIYRLTVDREVIKLADGLTFANAIGYDPTRETFYCSDSFNVALAWDVEPDRSLSNRRVLLEKNDCDGLALDVEGNIWLSGFGSPGVLTRLTPEGRELPTVPTPEGAATQIRFGGADLRDCYLTIVGLGAGDELKDGKVPTNPSTLVKGRSQIPGVPVGTAQFSL